MFWFDSYKKVTFEAKQGEYLDTADEQCSYWVKPPKEQNSLDHIDVTFKNFQKGQVTVYLVAEGPNGEIEYVPGKELQPENGFTYQFML